jgi:hypothetical protein
MIRFVCPTCGNSLSAPSNKGGSLSSCPACNQMVQVPTAEEPEPKPRREGMRIFLALFRLFLWGICFAAIILAVASYVVEIGGKVEPQEKVTLAVQSLVWIFAPYYLARTFDDSTKSLEELCARMRRKKH